MQVSNFFIDWLSFTYKDSSAADLLSSFWSVFPELDAYKSEMFIVGGRNYAHGLCWADDVTIRFDDDNSNKGVNVEIPSHGLQAFFDLFKRDGKVLTVKEMFSLLLDRGCTPSRIDICFDDFTKAYKPVYYYKKFLSGSLVTRMRTVTMTHSGDGSGGTTFYLGDRRKRMLRIYDKSIQSGGEIDSIRYEVELHSTSALSFLHHIVSSPDSEVAAFGDYLLSIFDIRRVPHDGDTNKARWKKNEKWYLFVKLTFCQRFINVPTYKPETRIEEIEKKMEQHSSEFLYLIAKHGLKPVLRSIADKGLSARHMAILQKAAVLAGFHPDHYISGCLLLRSNGKGVVNL